MAVGERTQTNPILVWNCWTNNMRYDDGQPGYIIHAFNAEGKGTPITFCGVRWQETGMLDLANSDRSQWWEPSCFKCRRILVKLGLLKSIR